MKKLRKSMALLLAMAMVLATFGITVVSAAAFSDTSGHWAESVIDKWSNANVINGYEDGTFRPNDKVAYEEAVSMVEDQLGEAEEGQEASYVFYQSLFSSEL